jgi:hypothetical protein
MLYQKILKRTGYVYANLVDEDEKKRLVNNPHTKESFEFRPVKEVIATVNDGGEKTEPKEVKKLPKQQVQTEQ